MMVGMVTFYFFNTVKGDEIMDIVRADDCRCYVCGEVLKALFMRRVAKTFIEKAEWGSKADNTVVRVGQNLFRHKRVCKRR